MNQPKMNPKRTHKGKGRPTYSRFRGVTWHKRKRLWFASLYWRGARIYLGSFPGTKAGEREAAWFVDEELIHLGETGGFNLRPDLL